MVTPLNGRLSNQQEPIFPGIKIANFCGITVFDQVQKLLRGKKVKYKPFYDGLH